MESEIELLKKEITELKIQLSKYTNPQSKKTYYEKNKDKILSQQREYKKKKYHDSKKIENK